MFNPTPILETLTKLVTACDTGFALAVHIRYTRPSLLYSTYSDAWQQAYSERGYMLADPVVHWGLVNAGWVRWVTLKPTDAAGVIAAAEEYGLSNGWTYSTGASNSRTIAGLTKKRPFSDAERTEIAAQIDEVHHLLAEIETFGPNDLDILRRLI